MRTGARWALTMLWNTKSSGEVVDEENLGVEGLVLSRLAKNSADWDRYTEHGVGTVVILHVLETWTLRFRLAPVRWGTAPNCRPSVTFADLTTY
jgi:hypothetical protein